MSGEPDCTWISAWNELAVTLSVTNPTEVAASLVFVVQSPWAGSFVPNATFLDVDVDVDGEEVVAEGLLPQADTKTRLASRATGALAVARRSTEGRMRAIVRGRFVANQGLPQQRIRDVLTSSLR